jgi:hypothetical protein
MIIAIKIFNLTAEAKCTRVPDKKGIKVQKIVIHNNKNRRCESLRVCAVAN